EDERQPQPKHQGGENVPREPVHRRPSRPFLRYNRIRPTQDRPAEPKPQSPFAGTRAPPSRVLARSSSAQPPWPREKRGDEVSPLSASGGTGRGVVETGCWVRQYVARGLTGEPVPPSTTRGATVRRN